MLGRLVGWSGAMGPDLRAGILPRVRISVDQDIVVRDVNGSDIIRFCPDPNPENHLNYLICIRIQDYPYPYPFPKNYNG